MSKHVNIVILGHSYRLMTISRASEAQSSPLRNSGFDLNIGCVEKRADIAQIASVKTGGTVPLLEID